MISARHLILLGSFVLGAGCQHQPVYHETSAPFSIAQAIELFGDDYERSAVAAGRHQYTWRYAGYRFALPGVTRPDGFRRHSDQVAARLQHGTCELVLVADSGGEVVLWSAQGRACSDVLDSPEYWRENWAFF